MTGVDETTLPWEGLVGRGARLFGYAGLLPQVAAVAMIAAGQRSGTVPALAYGALILSFLGGIWWGCAMRRRQGQAVLALVAVLPSLAAFGIILAAGWLLPMATALVALGMAVLATIVVDRHLVRTGEAPGGWMALRLPLSIGLGGLTILAGLLGRVV